MPGFCEHHLTTSFITLNCTVSFHLCFDNPFALNYLSASRYFRECPCLVYNVCLDFFFHCTFPFFCINRNHNRNLKTSKALLKSQAPQGTSLFTSAATNQRGVSKGGSREAQVRIPEYQEGTE